MFLNFPDLDADPFVFEPELYSGVSRLNESETAEYIAHRLRLAGCVDETIISANAIGLIYRLAEGQPRVIDQVCSMALKCAFANNESLVSRDSVSMAAAKLGYPSSGGALGVALARNPGIEAPDSANLDWAETSREFKLQKQIIERLRDEAGASARQLETLQAEVARLLREEPARQRDAAERSEMRQAIDSMIGKIADLQRLYEAATEENRRLSDRVRSITEQNGPDPVDEIVLDAADDVLQPPEDPSAGHATAFSPTAIASGPGDVSGGLDVNEKRFLVAGESEADGRHFPIREGRMSLGKNFDNDIRIESDYVSSHHACIDSNEHNSVLIDLDTTNGTFVNGRRVRRHALWDGDEILIGKHRFRFIREQSPRRTNGGGVIGPGCGSWLDTSRFSAFRDQSRKKHN